ncbi:MULTISPECIES: hypothetical protein [Bacillus]|nr:MULTISPECIES: hypothetical protein [Bacillus]MDU0070634.1 hypothetical protein [Bacillus sp. IG6]MED8018498.1 hypothetical protein [Bacillus glycinifermentans]WKB79807.1 hypothetical protein QYM22_20265 [Bacillus glycinifermentans]
MQDNRKGGRGAAFFKNKGETGDERRASLDHSGRIYPAGKLRQSDEP